MCRLAAWLDAQRAFELVLQLLGRITRDCRKPTRITAVFSDGSRLFALRVSSDHKSPTLYMKRVGNDGLLLASEPLDQAAKDSPSMKGHCTSRRVTLQKALKWRCKHNSSELSRLLFNHSPAT